MVDISNVINVSTSTGAVGLSGYNVNSVLYLTEEQPLEKWTETYRIYKNATSVGTDFGTTSKVYEDAAVMFAQQVNMLSGSGYLVVAPLVVSETETETLSSALTRVQAEIYFGGWLTCKEATDEELIAACTLAESMDCISIISSGDSADFEDGGLFATVAGQSFSRVKMLYYGDAESPYKSLRAFQAAYVARGFSVDFSAQNSTITMNLKDLTGVSADTSVTETLYNTAASLGVDMYVSYNGLAKVVSNGNNLYFDDVYNELWFELKMRVEMFNTLATTSTKIPQTETGMDKIKSAARAVCRLGVYNGFLAPGTWNGTDTFGNQEDFYRNITDYGFYVYSAPIADQTQTERETRVAPTIQVACKQAGAIHKINLIINFEL